MDDRHFVGVLGFRSEEIGRSLDPLASSLEAWLPFDLAAAPNVMVLDRKHLDRLTAEEHLSGIELQIKRSTVLVQGSLKRVPGAPQLLLRLEMRAPGAPSPQPLTLTLATNDLPALRGAIASAVFDQLHVAKPAATVLDPAREAALFEERAQMLFQDSDYAGATQAAEAAYALDPTPENRMNAARLQNEAGIRCLNLVNQPGVARDPRGFPRLAAEVHLQILRHAVRAAELYREAVDSFLVQALPQPRRPKSFPKPWGSSFTFYALQLPPEPSQQEVTELRHELQQQSVALFRLERDYYAASWSAPTNGMKVYEHPQSRWSYTLADSITLLQEWTDDAKEWTNLLSEVVTHYQNPPSPFTVRGQGAGRPSDFIFWYHLSGGLPLNKFTAAEDRRILCQVMENFSRQPPSALQLAAMSSLLGAARRPGTMECLPGQGEEFLDRFLRDYPYDHPVRRQNEDFWFPSLPVTSVIINSSDLKLQERYGRAILEPILSAKDGGRLCSWSTLLTHWLEALERNGKSSEAFARAQQALDLLKPDLRVLGSGAVASLRPSLCQTRDRLAPLGSQLDGDWAGWELTLVPSDPPPRAEMAAALFQPEQLLTLWVCKEDANGAVLRLTAQPLIGGPRRSLGEATIEAFGKTIYGNRAVVLAADSMMACVGTGASGLVIFRNGEVKRFTETNGLPANDVRHVGLLNGEIYLSFPEGLASLNPDSGWVTELAATRSTERRSPFDGQSFSVGPFLPDPDHQRLWMIVGSWKDGQPGPLNGLWNYTPRSHSFEKRFAPPRGAAWLSFQRAQLASEAVWPDGPPVVAVDLQVGQATWLLGGKTQADVNDICWLWRGDELFAGGPMLSRHTPSLATSAILSRTPDGRSLKDIVSLCEPEPGHILMATKQGELWRLQHRIDSQAVRAVELNQKTRPGPTLDEK